MLVNEFARLVTVIFPGVAPTGTITLIDVAVTTVIGSVTLVPLNFTSVTLERFDPEIVTNAPTWPLAGVKELIVGGLITMKSVVLIPVPLAVTILTLPVTAVAGTVAVI